MKTKVVIVAGLLVACIAATLAFGKKVEEPQYACVNVGLTDCIWLPKSFR